MLTIQKIVIGAAAGQLAYLTSAEDRGDYYVGKHGDPLAAPAKWCGRLAGDLSLTTEPDKDTLMALMEGRDPTTGEPTVRVGANGNRVAAHDLTFSAPSSVTAAWVMADEARRAAIQVAHDAAVEEAFAHIEALFPLVRRRQRQEGVVVGKRAAPLINETAAGLVGAEFAHHTCRQTHGQAAAGLPPDPQLHTHVLLFGFAKRRDGHLGGVDSLILYRGRAQAGAVYRAALAARLADLGFAIERLTGHGEQYFELRDIPSKLRDVWSSRTKEQEARAAQWRADFEAKYGRSPTLPELRAWLATQRARKSTGPKRDLFAYWRAQARVWGIAADMVQRSRKHGARYPHIEAGKMKLIAELLSATGLTKEHATFDVMALRTEAYKRAPGLIPACEVEPLIAELLRRQDVTPMAEGVWTTREMLGLEHAVIAWKTARERGGAMVSHPAHWKEAIIRSPVKLSAEQLAAVEALRKRRAFTALVGEAGVGKGVVLRVAANAWRAEGRRVIATAVGGAQAQRLAADLGEGTLALTLDALTHRLQHARFHLNARDVIAVDEASQVDTRRWAALAEATPARNSPAIVALGDPAQLSSIGAGGLWPHLADEAARLTEVHRTHLPWERKAWAHMRRGESSHALELYAHRGRVSVAATRAAAVDQAVAAWDADGRGGLIVTDSSNAERYRANAAAQGRRVANGELGFQGATVSSENGEVRLHTRDRVIFKGQYLLAEPGVARVENGTTAEVLDVNQGGTLRVRTTEASPRELTMPASWEGGHLDLNYAAHVASAQGTTVSRAYVVAGGWQTNRESLYVAVSRSAEGSHLFVDRETLGHDADADAIAELARRAAESRAKSAAISRRLPRQWGSTRKPLTRLIRTARTSPRSRRAAPDDDMQAWLGLGRHRDLSGFFLHDIGAEIHSPAPSLREQVAYSK